MRIEAPARCAGRRRYHDLQDVQTCRYNAELQCSAVLLDGATQQTAHRVTGPTKRGAPGATHTIIILHRHLIP
jgi:hypothetical protein